VPAVDFAPIDWVIVVLYLGLSLGIGIFGKRFVGDLTHFLVAGRELGVYAGIATLAATEIGTITYMYMAELGYKAGFGAFAAALISGISMIVVGRTGFVISRLRDLELMTVPEYFEVKYSRGLRILTGFVVAIGGLLNMGVFLKIEGEFLMTVSGIDARYLVAVMTGILLLELVYTVLGGMVSVVITDFMQYILLSIATILISLYAVHRVGYSAIVAKVALVMGPAGFSPIANPRFGWTFLLWQALLWVSLSTCWQTTAMRMFSTKSPETAKKVMTLTGVLFLGRGMLPMLWGMCALVMFGTGPLDKAGIPAPIVNAHTVEPIAAMPAMLAQILAPGVRGVVVAGMLAATMSVNSSYLLGWSSVISQDIVVPLRVAVGKGELSSKKQILINRISNVFVSLFILFWGLYYTLSDAVYLYLGLTCTIYLSGVFVSVVGGLYWRRSNVTGGYAAMILGGVGTIVPFFFLRWSANVTGFVAFGLSAVGLIVGSLSAQNRRRGPETIRT
jgi:SSS family solute:Na+ symporter